MSLHGMSFESERPIQQLLVFIGKKERIFSPLYIFPVAHRVLTPVRATRPQSQPMKHSDVTPSPKPGPPS